MSESLQVKFINVMQKFVLSLISYLLHPLFIPTLGLLILFNTGNYLSFLPIENKRTILIILGLSTCVLPLSFIPFFLYKKIIHSIETESRRERIIPLIVTTFFYFFAYYLVARLPISRLIGFYQLACSLTITLALLVSIFWKISLHMIGIGGLVGTLLILGFHMNTNVFNILVFAVIAAGLLGFARLRLNKHTPLQVYVGFLLGVFSMFGGLNYLLNL